MLRSIVAEDGPTVTRRPSAEELSAATSRERTRAVLGEHLVAGAPAGDALIASVRELARHGNIAEARTLVRAARGVPALRLTARAADAVIAASRGRFEAAGKRLSGLSRDAALSRVPAELVAVEFAEDPPMAVATLQALLDSHAELGPEAWLDLARHAFARGEPGLCGRALARLREGATSIPERVDAEARWLERWMARAQADLQAEPVAEGQVAMAVLDYKLPDYRRTSANVGDYIQTVASLGHLVRHGELSFRGDPELVSELVALRDRVRPDRRLSGIEREVAVVAVNRDASSLDSVPEGTWLLAFGWYMHDWFRVRYDFPFHPRLRPLFISFHVNRPGVLSERGVAYLRAHAPIGCRDWGTVRRLLELGVPAFFSGCLTTTVDLLFEAEPPRPDTNAPLALVDLPRDAEPPHAGPTTRLSHADLVIREAALPANIDRAVRRLESYRRNFSGVVTSRLHCYLPARALGVDATFRPRDERDIRFEGLVGIDDASFAAMGHGIGEKLEAALSSILRGDDEPTVREGWHEVCAPDVEAARRRLRA
jgi:hypothetical protein